MSKLLSRLQLSHDTPCDGLVAVTGTPLDSLPLSEQRIIKDTYKINDKIDYVFFRRFNNGEITSSQLIAYVIDNSGGKLTDKELSRLHHTLWLNGTIPLLYVDRLDRVDILSCMAEPVSNKVRSWEYKPLEQILSTSACLKT